MPVDNMGSIDLIPHIVITPSRDDAIFLKGLVDSMVSQTCPPIHWVIVDHNSKDNTQDLLTPIVKKYDWISTIRIDDESQRKRGGQIATLFNKGLSSIKHLDWHYCSKIDADMILPEDYFMEIISRFNKNPSLGIASGSCYLLDGNRRKVEKVSQGHTRGGLKTYRKSCFEHIGGVREVDGWDGLDNVLAEMNGWETQNFPEIEVLHRRATGSFFGILRGCFESGKFAYSLRYSPTFMLARSVHRLFRKPLFIGGIAMMSGFIFGCLKRLNPSMEPHESTFFRKKQRARLLNWWRM